MTPDPADPASELLNISSILFALQNLDSEEIVPLNADTSEVLRVLSNLCIQAHQQLIRIVEDRLQSIIGGAASRLRSSHFFIFYIFSPSPTLTLSQYPLCWRARPSVFPARLRSWLRPGSEPTRTPEWWEAKWRRS